jgi:hypothetical protein
MFIFETCVFVPVQYMPVDGSHGGGLVIKGEQLRVFGNVLPVEPSVQMYSVQVGPVVPVAWKTNVIQWNLWIATLRNENILWNKDTSSGLKLLFSVQIALWNEDTSELGTLMARPKGVLISQVSLYV